MTIEACVTKLSYLMGRGLRGEVLRRAMETDLRGEITNSGSINEPRIHQAYHAGHGGIPDLRLPDFSKL